MSNEWAVAAAVAGLVGMTAAGVCFAMLRRLQRRLRQRQRDLEEQVGTLDDAVRMVEARLSELHPAAGSAAEGDTKHAPEAEQITGESVDAGIAPEIQAAIAAAAVASLGANARLRSARLVKPQEDASAWSQQGRVLVQSSHNVRTRR